MTPTAKDGAASPIAIGPDDTLLDVFDRIRAAGPKPVELRIPNESSLFLTAAEFRTLRDVTDHGRHAVTIRTPDPHRLQLAKLFGLDVALSAVPAPAPRPSPPTPPPASESAPASTKPAPKVPPKPEPAKSNDEPAKAQAVPAQQPAATTELPVDKPASSISGSEAAAHWPEAVEHKPTPAAPRRLLDRVSAGIAARRPNRVADAEPEETPDGVAAKTYGPATDELVADPAAAESAAEPEPGRIHWVGDHRRLSPLVIVGIALFVALIAIMVLTFLLPSARIQVELASLPINSGITFDVTADGQPLDDEAAFALPGEPAEITVTFAASIPATGVQTIPDGIAAGTIRLANPTAAEITIEAGTTFTTETGTEFAVVEAVVVPAADAVTLAPGEADGAIQAVNPGTGGNVETGEIGGRLANGVYYSNRQSATSGGSDREVRVVAQADLDALVEMAEAGTLELVAAELQNGEARAVVAPSLAVLDSANTFDQTAGSEADTVSLEAERTVSVLTYDQAEASQRLASELGEQLQATVPEGFRLGPVAIGADDVTPLEGSADGGRFRVDAEARATLALTPEKEAELAALLAGRSPAEVREIMASWPEVATFEVEPGFGLFTSNMPANAGRIEIDDGS